MRSSHPSRLPPIEHAWLEERTTHIPDPRLDNPDDPADPDNLCLICKDDFIISPHVLTPCRHLYHLECLRNGLDPKIKQREQVLKCCYCQQDILDRLVMGNLEVQRRGSVPMHFTLQQYEVEK